MVDRETKMQKCNSLSSFQTLFTSGANSNSTYIIEGLCGRIVKGRSHVEDDFKTLTDCETDRTCFMMGSDGLVEFCKTGFDNAYEMLLKIGFEEKYIREKLDRNFRFELLVFPIEGNNIVPATWQGAFQILQDAFPDVHQVSVHTMEEISTTPYLDLLQKHSMEPTVPFEVRSNGKSDERYLNYDRFVEKFIKTNTPPTALDVRMLMYYEMGIRDLYAGDGYTKTEKGERGISEYLMRNRPRDQVEHAVIRLKI